MWQAGLLCLVATAQAVVVHQSPVYSHDSNKLQPQTVYRTALNPQTTYSQPQNTYSQPQNTYNHPQNTYNQPQNTYNQPQNTYNQNQNTYSQPQNTYSQPQNTYNQPQNIYSYPQQLLSHPQPLPNPPQQLLNHHQPLPNHPQQLQTHPQQLQSPPQQLPSYSQQLVNHLQPSIPSNHKEDDYYDEPSYSFTYQVHDDLTGDQKSHSETRKGDVVQGSYSLIEPDGSRRIVDYIADKIGGFRAQVRREHGAAKPIVAPKPPVPVYQPVNPAVQNHIPRYNQAPQYQNGPVTFTPAKYVNSQLQPAPVTEQAKYTTATVKPPKPYSPVVYASDSTDDKARTAPGTFTNPNQIPYKPVQYA